MTTEGLSLELALQAPRNAGERRGRTYVAMLDCFARTISIKENRYTTAKDRQYTSTKDGPLQAICYARQLPRHQDWRWQPTYTHRPGLVT